VIGKVMDDLLAGHLAIRIVDPLSEQPLAFERPSAGANDSEAHSSKDGA
jgi:hypothetical protein